MLRGLGRILLACIALAVLPAAAHAATIDVDSTDDAHLSPGATTCVSGGEGTGPCTLRAAVELADSQGGPQTINVPAGHYSLELGQLSVGGETAVSVTIAGAGAASTTIDGQGESRDISVGNGDSLTVSGVTLTGGDTGGETDGGAILTTGALLRLDHVVVTGNSANSGGGIAFELPADQLTIDASTISGNTATGPFGGFGGGLFLFANNGNATITSTTIDHNTADYGGGIMESLPTSPINNSTIAANHANVDGGGLYLDAFGVEDLSFDTFAGNTAGDGDAGNLFVPSLEGFANLRLKGTIVAGGTPSNCVGAGSITDVGHNYTDGDGTDCALTDPTDLLNQTGALGSLADNGGPTQTIALLTGNAAIDAIKTAADCSIDVVTPPDSRADVAAPTLTTDQRGLERPFGAGCDIGAFEQHDSAFALGGGSASPSTVDPGGSTTITETVTNGGPAPGTDTTFTATLPSGVTASSANASTPSSPAARPRASVGCTISGQTVTCPLGLLNTTPADPSDAPSPSAFTVTLAVHANAPGIYTVHTGVTGDQHNPNPADASRDVPFTVRGGSSPALACSKRPLTLIDVLQRGSRVRLYGAADLSLAGQSVSILYRGRRQVATTKVGSDGFFSTTAPLPPARERNTDLARYLAQAGGHKSLNLKLHRRVILEPLSVQGDSIVLEGRVTAPLGRPPAKLLVQRRVSCKRFATVATFRGAASGRFRLKVKVPAGKAAAVYRISTKVRKSTRSHKLYPTFSLPEVVGF